MHNGRRTFLRGAAAGIAVVALAPHPVWAAGTAADREKRLVLRNLHTGEKARTVFWADGDFVVDGLTELNRVLRDHRTNEIARIDPRVLMLVHTLQRKVGVHGTIQIISGYRSPKSNAALRRAGNGVAKKSYHMRGMAIDLRIKGVTLSHLHKAALQLKLGGVGYYPKSDFIHVDTGPVRHWR